MQELNFTRFNTIHDITSSKNFRLSSAKLNRQEKKKIFGFEKYSDFFEIINVTCFSFILSRKQFIRLIRAKSSKERFMKIYQIGRSVLLERCGWKKQKSTIISCLCHHLLFFCHFFFCAYFLTNSHFIRHVSHITIWLWLFLLYRAPCYFHICHQWVWFCMTQ